MSFVCVGVGVSERARARESVFVFVLRVDCTDVKAVGLHMAKVC